MKRLPLTDITQSTISSTKALKDGPKEPVEAKTPLQMMVNKELCFLATKQRHSKNKNHDEDIRRESIVKILFFTGYVRKMFTSFELACQLFDHLTLPYVHGKGFLTPRFPLKV